MNAAVEKIYELLLYSNCGVSGTAVQLTTWNWTLSLDPFHSFPTHQHDICIYRARRLLAHICSFCWLRAIPTALCCEGWNTSLYESTNWKWLPPAILTTTVDSPCLHFKFGVEVVWQWAHRWHWSIQLAQCGEEFINGTHIQFQLIQERYEHLNDLGYTLQCISLIVSHRYRSVLTNAFQCSWALDPILAYELVNISALHQAKCHLNVLIWWDGRRQFINHKLSFKVYKFILYHSLVRSLARPGIRVMTFVQWQMTNLNLMYTSGAVRGRLTHVFWRGKRETPIVHFFYAPVLVPWTRRGGNSS